MLSAGKPQEYILVWSGDEPKQINSIGELVFVPGINEVSQGKGQYRYPAAVLNGRPLPGTVAIHDRFSSTNGEVRKIFDALSFCQMLESNQKALFEMGFDVVLRPEEVAASQEKGREKWERAEFVHLEEIVRHAKNQSEYWKQRGMPRPASSSDESTRKAIAKLNQLRESGRFLNANPIKDDELDAALGLGQPVTGAPVPLAAPADIDTAAVALTRAVFDAKLKLTQSQTIGLMERNPEVMAEVQAKLESIPA